VQADPDLVLGGFAIRGVVDLKAQFRPSRKPFCEAIGQDTEAVSRHIGGKKAIPALFAIHDLRPFRVDADDDVMNHGPRGGQHFVGAHPSVFREARFHGLGLVRHGALRLHRDSARDLENSVGFAQHPLLVKAAGQGGIGRVALGALRVEPCQQLRFITICEGAVIGPLMGAALLLRGEPRRHCSAIHLLLNHASVLDDLSISLQAEGSQATLMMAGHAVRLKDAADIAVIGEPSAAGHGRGISAIQGAAGCRGGSEFG
jgi:hypothetical protein